MCSWPLSPVFVSDFKPALYSFPGPDIIGLQHQEKLGTQPASTMCTLKKQCYACKGACVEQVVVHCPKYLAGQDCGQSDRSRAGQAGGMLLQEILHLAPCPKHGNDNPHDHCKAILKFLLYKDSVNTKHLLGSLASLSVSGPRA